MFGYIRSWIPPPWIRRDAKWSKEWLTLRYKRGKFFKRLRCKITGHVDSYKSMSWSYSLLKCKRCHSVTKNLREEINNEAV